VPVDVRIIATCNRSLAQMVAAGEFRADLYYRLNVFPLALPPLRDRAEDIPGLAEELLRAVSGAMGRRTPTLGEQALQALALYPFPGNVRELGNILERALVRCRAPVLDAIDLDLPFLERARAVQPAAPIGAFEPSSATGAPDGSGFPAGLPLELAALEQLAIVEALRVEAGNRTHAARRLGISIRTLRNKLRLYREVADWKRREPVAHSEAPGRTAGPAERQFVPGRLVAAGGRARSTTLARPSQRLAGEERES
jgi:DNA-binding NtrC family response regulator